jgi:hypothetical protein
MEIQKFTATVLVLPLHQKYSKTVVELLDVLC